MKTQRRRHHDMYRHASLEATLPAFCVNYTAVCLYYFSTRRGDKMAASAGAWRNITHTRSSTPVRRVLS